MAFTTSAAATVLASFLGKTQQGILGSCYIGLSSTPPTADGGNFTEPDPSTGYARAIIGIGSQGTTQVMTIDGASAENDSIIYFPEAVANQGTVTHFGLFSSETGGEPKIYGALSSSVSIPANHVPLFRVGQFTMTLA